MQYCLLLVKEVNIFTNLSNSLYLTVSLQKTNYRNSKAVFFLICHVVYVMDKRLYFPYFRHRNYFPTITIKIMTKQNLK